VKQTDELHLFNLSNQARIQRHFLGQTAASGCEGFPTFRELTSSPSSGCVGGLVAPKLMAIVQLCSVYITVRPVAGRNATLLVSGSQKVVAVGLRCLLLVVESV
jgi:hypothetical protein